MDNDPTLAAVAGNVRDLRRGRGWTLEQLSAELDSAGHPLSLNVLSRIETMERGVRVQDLVALARVFGVSVDRLLAAPEVPEHFVQLLQRLASYKQQVRRCAAEVERSSQDLELRQAELEEATEGLEGAKRWLRDMVSESGMPPEDLAQYVTDRWGPETAALLKEL